MRVIVYPFCCVLLGADATSNNKFKLVQLSRARKQDPFIQLDATQIMALIKTCIASHTYNA